MAVSSSTIPVRSEAVGVSLGASPVILLGRFLFVLIFLMSAPMHFSSQTIGYAATQGVPLASLAVPLSGVIALAGALSILLGYRARIGTWLMVLFLAVHHVHEERLNAGRSFADYAIGSRPMEPGRAAQVKLGSPLSATLAVSELSGYCKPATR